MSATIVLKGATVTARVVRADRPLTNLLVLGEGDYSSTSVIVSCTAPEMLAFAARIHDLAAEAVASEEGVAS